MTRSLPDILEDDLDILFDLGGTASLDSVIEKKFAKKAELVEKNKDVAVAAHAYAIEQGWDKWIEDFKKSKQTVGAN